ncbi:MAG TPA: proline dehydrogenase family protein [Jatrophihabitans sp.]|jgi:RHH-type proline utilization regulon transcriptional repressor/proline dehydrogenase/delta 1-pyrroline-5-carboxylate dehydrogenase
MGDTTGTDGVIKDEQIVAEVLDQVRAWLAAAAAEPVDPAGKRLAGVLKDPRGLAFTVGFVDGVIRPEDPHVAARNFAVLAKDVPASLPLPLRAAVKLGASTGRIAPEQLIPIVRRALRQMVGHLVVDATDTRLGKSIAALRRDGTRLNVNLLGEAVLGAGEAGRRLNGTYMLLARPDIDYVSIKVSSTVAPHSPWAFDEAVAHVEQSLLPLYTLAATSAPQKFINLDMEEYEDLDLTIAVFTRLLDRPELLNLEAGIVLQAYLPDALGAMIRLQEWAAARRARGGAAVKVRLVKGANLPMEKVEAELHGWPLATWATKQQSDTNYKRVLNYALRPEHIANVRLGVAGHNLFDVAYAWALAKRRLVVVEDPSTPSGVEFEMLLGMATGQAEAVRRTVGSLLLYTPVVHPQEFDVAIAYLIRRLEEGASEDNFMSAVFDLASNERLFEREKQRFLASLADVDDAVPTPNRRQSRWPSSSQSERGEADDGVDTVPEAPTQPSPFHNTADTDSSLPGNREWARQILARVPSSTLGNDLVAATTLTSAEQVEEVIGGAVAASANWAGRSGADRAIVLRAAAVSLERARADLVEVMASECGKTVDQGDVEVSEAIDFANYYASCADDLDRIDGARHVPVPLTLVVPPWNFPVAIPAGSTLAALAAGSAVVIKPAPQATRCGSVMVQALWDGGVPTEVLRLAQVDEGDLGRQLVSDQRVGRLVLTGSYETAALFRSFRPDLPLLAETSGKNAILVTPSADLDLAVKDVVNSAFGHAGQKCSAASLAILVGSVAQSRRFRTQLVDAVSSLTVGYPDDPTAQMGPVIEPVSGKLERALTTLSPGESWLVEPKPLDATRRLWSPGVKTGVQAGSEFHLTEYFGPVLGIITAETLEEAIGIQNQVEYGLTAGLHSLDRDELATWLGEVQAGNIYINRGITGAIVRRQPFGGWKKSAVGAGTKAGGPNYLIGLSNWEPSEATASGPSSGFGVLGRAVLDAAKAAGLTTESLERALRSDAEAWASEFGVAKDVSGLTAERDVLRYLPVPVEIRLTAMGYTESALRVAAAGARAGAAVTISTATALPEPMLNALEGFGQRVVVQSKEEWLAALTTRTAGRIRLVGAAGTEVYEAAGGRPDLAIYDHPVTEAGRIELLPFLHEQAVSITAHRFGTPSALSDGLL